MRCSSAPACSLGRVVVHLLTWQNAWNARFCALVSGHSARHDLPGQVDAVDEHGAAALLDNRRHRPNLPEARRLPPERAALPGHLRLRGARQRPRQERLGELGRAVDGVDERRAARRAMPPLPSRRRLAVFPGPAAAVRALDLRHVRRLFSRLRRTGGYKGSFTMAELAFLPKIPTRFVRLGSWRRPTTEAVLKKMNGHYAEKHQHEMSYNPHPTAVGCSLELYRRV